MSGDGTIFQSSNRINPGDYAQDNICFPVVGIVLRVFYSDDPNNRSAAENNAQRGYHTEAQVLVIHDGTDTPWFLPHVKILPVGASGVENFHEELPKGCSQMLDGSKFNAAFESINYEMLDGDFCIVQFLGGNISNPIMTNWYPHPGNRRDPATNNFKEDTLIQARRLFKRYQGTVLCITSTGDIYVDTNEANTVIKGQPKGYIRQAREGGGRIDLNIKRGQELEVNFNPTVNTPSIPSLPQTNPPIGETVRETTSTVMKLSQDDISLIAGKVVQMIGQQITDSIILGANAQYHALLGEKVQTTFNALVAAFNKLVSEYVPHYHAAPDGRTSIPLAAGSSPIPNPWVATVGSPYFGILYVVDPAIIAASQSTPFPLPSQPTGSGAINGADMPATDLSVVVKLQ